jgi:hypothetical protein
VSCIFSKWVKKRREKRVAREKRIEQLWLWIGYVNISRAAPREMIGPQNLAKVPNWMLHNIRAMASPTKVIIAKFDNDMDFEYKFKPRQPGILKPTFYIDVYRRPQRWRKLL